MQAVSVRPNFGAQAIGKAAPVDSVAFVRSLLAVDDDALDYGSIKLAVDHVIDPQTDIAMASVLLSFGTACAHLLRLEFESKYRIPALIPIALRLRYRGLEEVNRLTFAAAEDSAGGRSNDVTIPRAWCALI